MADPAAQQAGPPATAGYDLAKREAAARLTRDHPRWYVMWGPHSRRYYAYPLFNAPPGTILTATSSGGVCARMDEAELINTTGRLPIPSGPQPDQPPEGGPRRA